MDPDCNRQNAVENDTVVLNLCKKYHVPVVMDSDAPVSYTHLDVYKRQLLVVASIDGSSLGEPLKQAKEAGIPVISYDRLLMNSDAVT